MLLSAGRTLFFVSFKVNKSVSIGVGVCVSLRVNKYVFIGVGVCP